MVPVNEFENRPDSALLRRLPTRMKDRADRGQALVEFVLALPILLVLVFGIIEFATAWRAQQLITNIAREGARLAVTPDGDQASVETRIANLLDAQGLNSEDATVTYACDGVEGSICGAGMTGLSNEITIDYPYTFRVFGPVMNLMCTGCGDQYGTITLSTTSIMRKE